MTLKYNLELEPSALCAFTKKNINLIYKLLPMREEHGEWEALLSTIIVSLAGMSRLLGNREDYVSLVAKLEGLYTLADDKDFNSYRRTIFECIGLLSGMEV